MKLKVIPHRYKTSNKYITRRKKTGRGQNNDSILHSQDLGGQLYDGGEGERTVVPRDYRLFTNKQTNFLTLGYVLSGNRI